VARATCAVLTVLAKYRFKLFKDVGLRTEMAEVEVVLFPLLIGRRFHTGAIVTMKSIAFNERGGNCLSPENLLEGAPH
jgi:hypothetical protein